MKEVSFTFSDYSPADVDSVIFGFVIFQVYYKSENYGYFASEKSAKNCIASLKKHFNFPFKVQTIHVSF